LTVDHVTVAGRNLEDMRASLAAVGIGSEYGGRHGNHATEMALTSFPDGSYLELIALQPDADAQAVAAHEWAKQMRNNAGPCAWAIRVKDIAIEIGRLQKAEVDVGAPARNGRARPDGTRLDWETARVGHEPNGTFFPFLIRDFTPRELRAFPQGKPTTEEFSGITKIVIAVHDLEAAAARYAKAYGAAVTARQTDSSFGARLALLGSTPVVLATPLSSGLWLAGRLDQFGEGPIAFVVSRRPGGRQGGGRQGARYKTASKSRWFGSDISWFDSVKLGWRLGYE
jgi:hypothetical protein